MRGKAGKMEGRSGEIRLGQVREALLGSPLSLFAPA